MNKSRVLCVDDEQNVLDGLQRLLRGTFEVSVALSGQAALDKLKAGEVFEIIVSDMRMPGMSGAQLLSECRHLAPDTVRVLLTGHSDLDSAIAAVNEGHIFRFLTKPCAQSTLTTTLRAAALQHRLLTAERVLLEQTLVGSVRALSEVLTLTHPEAFGLAARQHERAREVAEKLGMLDAWQVEVASILSSVGYAVLPEDVLGKLMSGKPLEASEREMVGRLPQVVESILSHVPRLESVREVLKHTGSSFDVASRTNKASNLGSPLGARVLRAVLDLSVAEARLGDTQLALSEIEARRDYYGSNVLDAVRSVCAPRPCTIRGLKLGEIAVGMVLLDQVKSESGTVVVARGQRVTPQLLERIRNFGLKHRLAEPIRCEVPLAE